VRLQLSRFGRDRHVAVEVYLYPLGVLVLFALFFWLPTRFRYRITDRSLQVRLFGIPVRWVSLDNIRFVGTHRSGWGEHWSNSWSSGRRYLIIRRRSGLFRDFIITPKNRFVFRAELQRKLGERKILADDSSHPASPRPPSDGAEARPHS
jgi:hypothetical protein